MASFNFHEIVILLSLLSLVAICVFNVFQLLLCRYLDMLPAGRKGKPPDPSRLKGLPPHFGPPKMTSYIVVIVSSVLYAAGYAILTFLPGTIYEVLSLTIILHAVGIPLASTALATIVITIKGGWGLAKLSHYSGTTESP
jgi:hypothetical protein